MNENLTLIPQTNLADRVKSIQDEGYVYFPNAMTPDEVTELKKAMDKMIPIEASFNRNHTLEKDGFLQKHINNAFNHDSIFIQYLDRPEVIDLIEAVHG